MSDYRFGDEEQHEQERSEQDHPHGAVPAKHSTAGGNEEHTHDVLDNFVEETSRDSYPGSDAPAW